MLTGLDLSAAFDTVCHSTLVKRLQTEFEVSGTALSWIQSYLQDQTQFVKLGQHRFSETTLEVGVPHGSVLGLLLFAESGVIFDVSIRRGCRLAGGRFYASSQRHSRSSPDFRLPRVSRSAIMQLPRTCDLPHTPSTDAGL